MSPRLLLRPAEEASTIFGDHKWAYQKGIDTGCD